MWERQVSCFGKMGGTYYMRLGPYSIHSNIQVLQFNKPPQPCPADMEQPVSQQQEHLDCNGRPTAKAVEAEVWKNGAIQNFHSYMVSSISYNWQEVNLDLRIP
jgi:hypothetical protein